MQIRDLEEFQTVTVDKIAVYLDQRAPNRTDS